VFHISCSTEVVERDVQSSWRFEDLDGPYVVLLHALFSSILAVMVVHEMRDRHDPLNV